MLTCTLDSGELSQQDGGSPKMQARLKAIFTRPLAASGLSTVDSEGTQLEFGGYQLAEPQELRFWMAFRPMHTWSKAA